MALHSDQDQITVRLVDANEMTHLNETYRQKSGPTNVLSFEMDLPDQIEAHYLGDVVICLSVLEKEAKLQQKDRLHHFAHLLIHGILHLRGYDHQDEKSRTNMEALEIKLLSTLNINNPYEDHG